MRTDFINNTDRVAEVYFDAIIGRYGTHGAVGMGEWPKDKLLRHGPELPMHERIRCYQHNVRTIRAAGCAVPTSAMIDTLDPAEIELWFADSAFQIDRLGNAISALTAEIEDPDQ